jgi:uncharacterized protein (TIGR02449 family)
MDTLLNALAAKIEQLVARYESLRDEKHILEIRLKTTEEERDRLHQQAALARERIERLMSQLPERET